MQVTRNTRLTFIKTIIILFLGWRWSSYPIHNQDDHLIHPQDVHLDKDNCHYFFYDHDYLIEGKINHHDNYDNRHDNHHIWLESQCGYWQCERQPYYQNHYHLQDHDYHDQTHNANGDSAKENEMKNGRIKLKTVAVLVLVTALVVPEIFTIVIIIIFLSPSLSLP